MCTVVTGAGASAVVGTQNCILMLEAVYTARDHLYSAVGTRQLYTALHCTHCTPLSWVQTPKLLTCHRTLNNVNFVIIVNNSAFGEKYLK